jgi:hypothetical protein
MIDQGVGVVGAFAGLHGLQIGHVAKDGVLVGDAVAAEDVASHAGALQRQPSSKQNIDLITGSSKMRLSNKAVEMSFEMEIAGPTPNDT